MPHLATGYRELIAVNIWNLKDKEYQDFFKNLITKLAPDDVFFVIHDGSVFNRRFDGFEKIAIALQ